MRTYKIFKSSALNATNDMVVVEAYKIIPDEGPERYEVYAGDLKWGPYQPKNEEEAITLAKALIKIIKLFR